VKKEEVPRLAPPPLGILALTSHYIIYADALFANENPDESIKNYSGRSKLIISCTINPFAAGN
jgi:hypothetical protein